MAISPEGSVRRAERVLALVSEGELRMMDKVARRLARGIDQQGWAEQKLLEIHALRREVEAEVRRLGGSIDEAVASSIDGAYREGFEEAVRDMEDALPSMVNRSMNRPALNRLITEAVDPISTAWRSSLRVVEDEYRRIIASSSEQVLSGVMTRREATQRALDQFADRGISGFVDKAGRRWDLATYSEMSVRTSTGRAAVAGHTDTLAANGQDLVIVSDAPEECPICRPYEGKVLSISGTDPNYTSLESARYGGLFHANCRHSVGIYLPGITPPKGTPDPERYEDRQQQRHMERQVRKWKRRESVALDPLERVRAQAKVREWQGRLRHHVAVNDRKRLYSREQILRGRAAQRPAWAPEMSREDAEAFVAGSRFTDDVFHQTSEASAEAIRREGFNLEGRRFGRVWGDGVYAGLDEDTMRLYTGSANRDPLTLKVRLENPLEHDPDPDVFNPGWYNIVTEMDRSRIPDEFAEEVAAEAIELGLASEEALTGTVEEIFELMTYIEQQRPTPEGFVLDPQKKAFRRLMDRLGHDGIIIRERHGPTIGIGGNQVVVFDPRRVVVIRRG